MADYTYVLVGNLRGPKGVPGDKGDPGDDGKTPQLDASATSVDAGQEATVEMSGTALAPHAHFSIPRGLPGVNAIENDEAVAAYVGAVDSATGLALLGRFPVHRVWDGAAYPDRIPGAVNLFIGPENPGLDAEGDDMWVGSDYATLDDVAAEVLDSSSLLHSAVLGAVASSERIWIGPGDLEAGPGATQTNRRVGSTDLRTSAYELPEGAQGHVIGSFIVPERWSTVRFRIYFDSNENNTAGDLRWFMGVQQLADGQSVGDESTVQTFTNTGALEAVSEATRHSKAFTGLTVPVQPGRPLYFYIARRGDLSADTVSGPIWAVGVEVERLS